MSSPTIVGTAPDTLQELAQRHLWLHFTAMGGSESPAPPVIVRGEGCHVYDSTGRRLLDGLSSLFCVNIGHGRADLAEAAARQGAELAYFSNWSFAHPPSIELAARIAHLAPGDLNRVFFTGGGSEAVESAIKLARQYHKLSGAPLKTKIIARAGAYHGTSMGALALTGIASMKVLFEPLMSALGAGDGIKAAVAVAAPDELGGEDEIKVFLVLDDPTSWDPRRFFAYCTASLPRFAQPRFIELVTEEFFARGPGTGAVQKHLLPKDNSARTIDRKEYVR